MSKKALHFGAGNIGRGFICPELQNNDFEVIFADVNQELVDQINSKNNYKVEVIEDASLNQDVTKVSALNISDTQTLNSVLGDVDLITTSVGPQYVKSVFEKIQYYTFHKKIPFVAFENKYRASSSVVEDLNYDGDHLIPLDAVVDKIVPPQTSENLDVVVESYGSIFIEDQDEKPLKVSSVVSYGDYEYEFTKKLWLLNGLHLQLAYFGLFNNLTYMHEIFEEVTTKDFATNAMEALKKAFILKTNTAQNLDLYGELILNRFALPQVNDELERVARNPQIKFSQNERFEYPLRVLLSYNESVETFKSILEILQNGDFNNVEGFEEFHYNFQDGIKEFFQKFWKINQDKIEIYIERLNN